MASDQPVSKEQDQPGNKSEVFNTKPSDLMEGFRKAVLGSAALQSELREAKSGGDLVLIAARHGFGLSEHEVQALRTLAPRLNLGEVQLGTVHLAAPCWCDPSVTNTRSC